MNRGVLLKAPSSVSLGQHSNTVQLDTVGVSPAVVTINSSVSGSAFVLFAGGELGDMQAPVDSKSNSLTQRGTDQGYAGGLWPGFGYRCLAIANGVGGGAHQVSITKTAHAATEISLVWIEVLRGAVIQAVSQGSAAAAGAGVPYSSPSIATTGRALLLALASGDGDAGTDDQTFTPSAGWTLFESSFLPDTAYVPFAVAYREVGGSGSYSLNWTPTVNQGAAMMMLAIQ